jgi:hypothetical protein
MESSINGFDAQNTHPAGDFRRDAFLQCFSRRGNYGQRVLIKVLLHGKRIFDFCRRFRR